MNLLRTCLVSSLLALVAASSSAAQIGDPNLATTAPGSTRNLRVKPGEYDLTILNRLPGKVYSIEVAVDFIPIAALTLQGFRDVESTPAKGAPMAAPIASNCDSIIDRVFTASDESDLPKLLSEADSSGCDEVRPLTMESLGSYELTAGQLLTVKIARDDKAWTWIYTTGDRGEWRTTYGFTFVPNEDRKYVTRPGTGMNMGKFEIFEQKDREELDFVPSVLFNWLPANQRGEDWISGFTGGLGWDLEKPVVFAGWSWMYNENFNLTFGVAVHQQTRLLGQYDKGGVVGEALESDQLVETTYGANFYVGMGFRFDRNNDPFARSAALQKQTAAAEAARQAAAANAAATKKQAEELQKSCEALAEKVRADDDAKCRADDEARRRAAPTDPDNAQKLADCLAKSQKTEAAAKAKCPADVAAKLAADEQARATREAKAAEEKRKDDLLKACKEAAAGALSLATAQCGSKEDGAIKEATNTRVTALAACGTAAEAAKKSCQETETMALAKCAQEPDAAKKSTCETDAKTARAQCDEKADLAKKSCEDKAKAAFDTAKSEAASQKDLCIKTAEDNKNQADFVCQQTRNK